MTLIQLVVLLLLAALLVVICRASYTIFKYMKAFPTDARYKNVKEKYSDLIGNLDEAIDSTTSINELNKALEHINYPSETILVVMQRENADSRDQKYALDAAIINRLQPENKKGTN